MPAGSSRRLATNSPDELRDSGLVWLTDRAEAAGALPAQPGFHRALADPVMLEILKNAADELGYALG